MGKYSVIFFLLLVVSFPARAHEASDTHPTHFKPGADIKFTHSYDGQTVAGEQEFLQLIFHSPAFHSKHSLKISLNPSGPLKVLQGDEFELIATENTVVLPLTLSAQIEGKYYLGIQAELTDAFGVSSARVFELPIVIGDVSLLPQKIKPVIFTESGRNIVILESVESGDN